MLITANQPLVKRLTGIDPDRLIEEKKRQLTIDLGFAWFTLGSDTIIGIVDVPGHRDFIENMLAGIGSIDAVMLVIAADEGIMPQTREHLAIIDLLGLQQGLIVLMKTDLVKDPDWIDLVENDIREVIHGTVLENARIIQVSAHTGDGIPELLTGLDHLVTNLPSNIKSGPARLSVDRVFTISGFGTVITGTLLGRSLSIGDEIELQPGSQRGRIRGLHSYEQSVETAYPGSRVAVNISGIDKVDVYRGQMLSHPNVITPTLLVDVEYKHLISASRDLKHNAEVKVFSGAAETVARVRLLDKEIIPPGESGWVQLHLESPLPLSRGDRYILRFPSPPETIGGGIIVNQNPGRRHKRFQSQVINHLTVLLQGTPAELVTNTVKSEPLSLSQIASKSGFDPDMTGMAVEQAVQEAAMVSIGKDRYFAADSFRQLQETAYALIAQYHRENPLRGGMPKEELRVRLKSNNLTLEAALEALPQVVSEKNLIRLGSHEIRFSEQQSHSIARLVRLMQATPYTPPSYKEAGEIVSGSVLRALIELGDIVQVQADVIFLRETYEMMVVSIISTLETGNTIDAKTLRDQFDTSRKYAIALLEHLDSIGITRRQGDVRVLSKSIEKST